MKISTEEFITLVQERPALWQKSHYDFANREIRTELLTELAVEAGADAAECSKKLKNLKDSMRAQVAKLPKTSSGLPAFHLSDHITWPFFKNMMFMSDEFVGRKLKSSFKFYTEDGVCYEPPEINEVPEVEENASHFFEPEELAVQQSSYSGTISQSQIETSNQSWDSFELGGAKRLRSKRRRPISSQYDYRERKLTILEKMASTDELDLFASDIANDLRKIKSPLKLLQAKSKIRRIAEEFAMSELLPPTSPH